jgi:hypothetical protein
VTAGQDTQDDCATRVAYIKPVSGNASKTTISFRALSIVNTERNRVGTAAAPIDKTPPDWRPIVL